MRRWPSMRGYDAHGQHAWRLCPRLSPTVTDFNLVYWLQSGPSGYGYQRDE